MKFIKTIEFEAAQRQFKELNSRHQMQNYDGPTIKQAEHHLKHQLGEKNHQNYEQQWSARLAINYQQQPLGAKLAPGALSISGQAGLFKPIQNDFTLIMDDESANDDDDDEAAKHYQEDPNWTSNEREEVKRVRFVICVLALFGLAFALMSRLILNVSIVEMVKGPHHSMELGTGASIDELATTMLPSAIDQHDNLSPTSKAEVGEQDFDHESSHQQLATTNQGDNVDSSDSGNPSDLIDATTHNYDRHPNSNAELVETSVDDSGYYDDGLHFNWTQKDVNMVIGSFYIGYMPGILLSGGLAQKYGAKYPLLICVLGTSIINILTPTIARFSLVLLVGSRIILGLIQGSLFPALYELFNRWLTATESSIFAPMIKVSMPFGSVMGSLMPGILASFGLEWPYLFYIGGCICLIWSLVWFYVATSMPQTNKYICESELRRIMRKKVPQTPEVSSNKKINHQQADQQATISSTSTPWLLIITNPSVLALTLVKYTYNIGMDFIYLELAVYMSLMHGASIETISVIASSSYCMQMLLITFVGWIAKTVVAKRAFGFSVTKWRKAFQGGSNFAMAFVYLILALTDPGLEIAALLLLFVCFAWMLGAGGESMVPYDLSSKYPASIVGFAHSVSILSGISVPAVITLVIGEEAHDPERWRLLFLLISAVLFIGGLVFVLVVKAKPFLPGEKVPKRSDSKLAPTMNGHSNYSEKISR